MEKNLARYQARKLLNSPYLGTRGGAGFLPSTTSATDCRSTFRLWVVLDGVLNPKNASSGVERTNIPEGAGNKGSGRLPLGELW